MSDLSKHIEYMRYFFVNNNLPAQEVYLKFKRLTELNASDKQIADMAFECRASWSNIPSENAYDALSDLALLEEEGFERSKEQINEIIEQIIL